MAVSKKTNIEQMRKNDAVPVKGIFHYHESPGSTLSFFYKAYKNDPLGYYDLKDGEVVTIPKGVAKHLNQDCWYPVYERFWDPTGKQQQRIKRKIQRFSFESTEYLRDEDLMPQDSKILTLEPDLPI